MKTSSLICVVTIFSCTLFSCGDHNKGVHSFDGTFNTATGVKFELKPDSTTFIQFNDSLTYEGTWSMHHTEANEEYANIEFAGSSHYYYLKNNKIYYSERDMRNEKRGATIEYLK